MATWNLERLPSRARRERVLAACADVDADVWVLTETDTEFAPFDDASLVFSGIPERIGRPEERWVAIASRHPIEPLAPTSDPARSVAALVSPPLGPPLVVYGTVLPWRGSTWHGRAGAAGYLAALDAQRLDWVRLRGEHPEAELVVAGDFNQDLSTSHYYWSSECKTALRAALEVAGLVALTADSRDPVRAVAPDRASIDHICVPASSMWVAARLAVWPRGPAPDLRLSDHFGVVAALDASAATRASVIG